MGIRLVAPDHVVRRAVRGRHRLEADRGRSEQAAGGERLAGARVRACRTRRRARRRRGQPDALDRLTHRTIKGVAEDMERFRFNTAISKLQVLTNEMRSALDAGGGALAAATALAPMLAPFAPFAAEELWREVLGNGSSVHVSSWPSYDPSLAARGHRDVDRPGRRQGPRQDRGPRRRRRGACLELARASESARRAIGDGRSSKEIVRAPRLVNVVTAR